MEKLQDLIAQNKMNVLHWHIVDNEAFPYTSAKFPDLSAKVHFVLDIQPQGAYSQHHRYSVDEVKRIIDYAADRGIRIVPEYACSAIKV